MRVTFVYTDEGRTLTQPHPPDTPPTSGLWVPLGLYCVWVSLWTSFGSPTSLILRLFGYYKRLFVPPALYSRLWRFDVCLRKLIFILSVFIKLSLQLII